MCGNGCLINIKKNYCVFYSEMNSLKKTLFPLIKCQYSNNLNI